VQQKTIVLTGATSGIGLELLHLLLNQGHHVIAVSRQAAKLQPVPNLQRYACDLARPDEVETVFRRIVAEHSSISVLINNAAVQHSASFVSQALTVETLIEECHVNLLAPALITHLLLPVLTKNDQSVIVNVSSGLAFAPKAETGLYCASKAGLHSLSQSLRYNLQSPGIAVSEVILPLVDTPMTRGRGSSKISANIAASAILQAMETQKPEIFVGKARLLPLLARFSPRLLQKIMGRL
jgi:uncharacterized oxidoreductase